MTLPDFRYYGELIYSLPQRYQSIRHSTLTLVPIGRTLAKLEGQIVFRGTVLLDVWELIDFGVGQIRNYSYEIFQAGEKVAWYDPFEHPHVSELASTHPHHKHIVPDIRHNRVPAPGISFDHPNVPLIIEEIERDFLDSPASGDRRAESEAESSPLAGEVVRFSGHGESVRRGVGESVNR